MSSSMSEVLECCYVGVYIAFLHLEFVQLFIGPFMFSVVNECLFKLGFEYFPFIQLKWEVKFSFK